MAENRFHFFRGSAPAFYKLWLRRHPRSNAPAIWLCGDAHWENVGSYRGKNRVAYFDLTDFDQACLAPLDAELARALTAYYVADVGRFAPLFLSTYRETLATGKPQHIEAEVAKGAVADLLSAVSGRRRKKFIESWADNGRIRTREAETFPLSRAERSQAIRMFRSWASRRQQAPFFEVLDLCGSLAGIGTLGLRRYLVLVRGGRRPHLIDMKEAAPSALAQLHPRLQPRWQCEAERVATVQTYTQYVPIAHLGWMQYRGLSFILSDFQPSEDRVDAFSLTKSGYEEFTQKWGRLLAWAHLRSASWKRGATIDDLMAFGFALDGRRQHSLIRRAAEMGEAYQRAYRQFLPLVE